MAGQKAGPHRMDVNGRQKEGGRTASVCPLSPEPDFVIPNDHRFLRSGTQGLEEEAAPCHQSVDGKTQRWVFVGAAQQG